MTTTAADGRTVGELVEERDFLLRSIEDLEREHAAGDVDDADFTSLRASYVERAAATLRALAAAEAERGTEGLDASAPKRDGRRSRSFRRTLGRRGTRSALVALGALCVLGLVGIAAARAAGVRLPGESATGSVTLTPAAQIRQELDQAQVLADDGQLKRAITVYDTVLASVPRQPEALAYKGWFVRLVGIAAKSQVAVAAGDATLASAVRVAPSYALARAFYGIALVEDTAATSAALVEFRAFLADHPSATLLDSVGAEMAATFVRAHVDVPAALRRFEAAGRR